VVLLVADGRRVNRHPWVLPVLLDSTGPLSGGCFAHTYRHEVSGEETRRGMLHVFLYPCMSFNPLGNKKKKQEESEEYLGGSYMCLYMCIRMCIHIYTYMKECIQHRKGKAFEYFFIKSTCKGYLFRRFFQ